MFALALRIRQSRKDARLSQAALARMIGVDRSAVAQWERNNAVGPTVGHLAQIALGTGVAFEWLATGRGPREPGGSIEPPPALVTEHVAQSETEERLLLAFRTIPPPHQVPVLEQVEALSREA